MVRHALAALLAGLALGAAGAADAQILTRRAETYTVGAAKQRYVYIDATMVNENREWRFFFRPTEACQAMFVKGAQVEWRVTGPFGHFIAPGDLRCDPVGVGSLELWRDRKPRAGDKQINPRGRSSFEVVWEDEEYAMVQGRMPYANRIGFSGGERAIALVQRTPACLPVIERGNAMLEYRRTGKLAFRFVTGRGQDPCAIRAFVQVIPDARPRKRDAAK